jgi:GxxExxY protein
MEKNKVMGELFYKDERYRIQGCIFEVNRKSGSGFPEAVYQEAPEIELTKAPIPFESQKIVPAASKITSDHKEPDFQLFGGNGVKIGIID